MHDFTVYIPCFRKYPRKTSNLFFSIFWMSSSSDKVIFVRFNCLHYVESSGFRGTLLSKDFIHLIV